MSTPKKIVNNDKKKNNYKINAIVEKFGFQEDHKQVAVTLKGVGKYFFETETDAKVKVGYNIIEFDGKDDPNETKHKILGSQKVFTLDISNANDNGLMMNLLSQAFIEGKRLKFGITGDKEPYTITSISKAD